MEDKLLQDTNYKLFRHKQKARAIFSFCLLIVFWLFSFFANNPDTEHQKMVILDLILFILTLTIIYFFYVAFIAKPDIKEGVITDIEINTVKRRREIKGWTYHTYKINCDDCQILAESVLEYFNKNDTAKIGDEVICFSHGKTMYYFIKS